MSKYTNEFKMEVIEYHEKNHLGCTRLAEYFGIPNECIVRRWIRRY